MRPEPSQSPLTAEEAADLVSDFRARLPTLTVRAATLRVHETLDALLARTLGDRRPACEAGCAACCHQPLLVGFLELALVWFSDEARFRSSAFVRRVESEVEYLARLRRQGLAQPAELAARQFSDTRPCLFLGAGGQCTIHAVRPVQCRNAFSWTRCTSAQLGVFGYGDLAVLGRRLRADVHAHFGLARFDPPPAPGRAAIRTATATFYLPEGLMFMRERMDLDGLRPLFAPPDHGA